MKNNPKVSIIVPAYKMEKYIAKCLESLINQTLRDIEIIVADENEFDETRRIIDIYKQKDKRIIGLHKPHGGYGASVNDGIKIAKGDYIGIVEADDFVREDMFYELYNLAIKNDLDIVKSDFYFYQTSTNTSRKAGKISKFLQNKITNIHKTPKIIRMQPSIWSAIYKRDFLLNNDIKFLNTKGGSYQDTSFSFKALSKAQKIQFIQKAYLYYRIDNESSSVKSKGKVFCICDEYKEIDRFLDENPEIKQALNTQKLIKQYNTYVWNLKRIDEIYRKDFIERFSLEFENYFKNGEIKKDFYKKVKKEDFKLLLFDKEKFEKRINEIIKNHKKREQRNKKFSLRINTSRMSVVVFGRQIFKLEF